ncbi:hypothetical protein MAMP_02090 [Methylophaga aminisulfidivorans MP]|uniref:Uncharacterized protein n=1 Tax=Methylophaga aminisulfidivorans MP TaxID=1026882 RepID=F5SXG5_9GAMM|nr:hypothetical protein MAMP_02090 [Methylophaga aminisulfidivorans MP]
MAFITINKGLEFGHFFSAALRFFNQFFNKVINDTLSANYRLSSGRI